MIEGKRTDAGLTGKGQIEIALKAINEAGGMLEMSQIYSSLESVMNETGFTLSFQGKSSLRFFINTTSVKNGFIYPHDKLNPGW